MKSCSSVVPAMDCNTYATAQAAGCAYYKVNNVLCDYTSSMHCHQKHPKLLHGHMVTTLSCGMLFLIAQMHVVLSLGALFSHRSITLTEQTCMDRTLCVGPHDIEHKKKGKKKCSAFTSQYKQELCLTCKQI